MKFLILLLSIASLAYGQIYFQPPLPILYQSQAQFHAPHHVPVAHRAVIENALREAQLPSEFMNQFYKNPKIAEALAKESWFTSKEMPVFEREAEKIPREMIYKIFKNAGWVKKR